MNKEDLVGILRTCALMRQYTVDLNPNPQNKLDSLTLLLQEAASRIEHLEYVVALLEDKYDN